ncbi:cysteine desulfurase family protein [Burkholderia sp. F1]|uniref:cysteine desulfurase family protein n=1 Tax=Burkholderia sp. F1 TaxID=3366817 RepID=UPI003D757F17
MGGVRERTGVAGRLQPHDAVCGTEKLGEHANMNKYFDHAASMQVSAKAWLDTLSVYGPGNPSSAHDAGEQARRIIGDTRNRIAAHLGCRAERIYFTSGATESANLLIQGYLATLRRKESTRSEIVVSAIEHPAVYQTVMSMKKHGYTVRELPVNRNGVVAIEHVDAAISERTAMLCLMAVNNETGAVQPVNEVARAVKRADPDILVVCDAVQHFAKLNGPIDLDVVDALFMSGHKIGADKGIGCFYLNGRYKLTPLMYGGAQEQTYRPGTENVFGIGLLGAALQEAVRDPAGKLAHVGALGERLIDGLTRSGIAFERLIPAADASPYILALAFPGVPSRQMIADLAASGYCVSQGSACSSHSLEPSRVLSAMRVPPEHLNSLIRISFSPTHTMPDIDDLATHIVEICHAYSDA